MFLLGDSKKRFIEKPVYLLRCSLKAIEVLVDSFVIAAFCGTCESGNNTIVGNMLRIAQKERSQCFFGVSGTKAALNQLIAGKAV